MSRMALYTEAHASPSGAGDARPTAHQVLADQGLLGALPDLTVLITGASTGMGLETARAAYETGAKVYITVRSPGKGEAAIAEITGGKDTSGRLKLLPLLDLASPDSVRACAAAFLEQSGGKLNVMICNAGSWSSTPGVNEKYGTVVEETFAANHLGHFLLFQLLKPALLASSTPAFQSRLVLVSSVGHRLAPDGIEFDDLSLGAARKRLGGGDNAFQFATLCYAHSKLATVYTANEVERRYGGQGLHAFSLQPGGVVSDLFRDAQTREATQGYYEGSGGGPFIKSPGQGAATQIWAAFGRDWEGHAGGVYLENMAVADQVQADPSEWIKWWIPGYGPRAFDPAAEAKLWDVSCQLVGVENEK